MTGPGRPGRDNQSSLTALAAREFGWDYSKLVHYILEGAVTLVDLKSVAL